MTFPKAVQEAVRYGDECWDDGSDSDEREMWQTIRAHLLSQDAEIDRLRTNENLSTLQHNKLLAKYELAESRLAAADALLRSEAALLRAWARESREGGWSTHQYDPMLRRANELDNHLQGAGDEA